MFHLLHCVAGSQVDIQVDRQSQHFKMPLIGRYGVLFAPLFIDNKS